MDSKMGVIRRLKAWVTTHVRFIQSVATMFL